VGTRHEPGDVEQSGHRPQRRDPEGLEPPLRRASAGTYGVGPRGTGGRTPRRRGGDRRRRSSGALLRTKPGYPSGTVSLEPGAVAARVFQPTARTRHERYGNHYPAVAHHAHDPAIPALRVAGQLYRIALSQPIREAPPDYPGQVALLSLDSLGILRTSTYRPAAFALELNRFVEAPGVNDLKGRLVGAEAVYRRLLAAEPVLPRRV
jgi:hypothetical protein